MWLRRQDECRQEAVGWRRGGRIYGPDELLSILYTIKQCLLKTLAPCDKEGHRTQLEISKRKKNNQKAVSILAGNWWSGVCTFGGERKTGHGNRNALHLNELGWSYRGHDHGSDGQWWRAV